MIRRGKRDDALPMLRDTPDELFDSGQFVNCPVATGFLMEALLDRGDAADVREAEAALDRLIAAPLDDGFVIRDVIVMRLRALLARARGDEVSYRDFAARYRKMATDFGFEGHMALARDM
jgi:hypothetical protein